MADGIFQLWDAMDQYQWRKLLAIIAFERPFIKAFVDPSLCDRLSIQRLLSFLIDYIWLPFVTDAIHYLFIISALRRKKSQRPSFVSFLRCFRYLVSDAFVLHRAVAIRVQCPCYLIQAESLMLGVIISRAWSSLQMRASYSGSVRDISRVQM